MDYLSNSTRRKQSAFLILCFTSICVSVFQLRLTKLEQFGFELLVPEYLLNFVLIISVCYLCVAYFMALFDETVDFLAKNREVDIARRGITRDIDWHVRLAGLFCSPGLAADYNSLLKKLPRDHNFDDAELNRNFRRLRRVMEDTRVAPEEKQTEIDRLGPQTRLLAEAEVKRLYREKLFVGFQGVRFYRVLVFDFVLPVLAFAIALAGWFGGLSWVAPSLELAFG